MFWDLFGEQGHPIRATVQEMGSLLLSRLLELNEVQEGVLNIMFRFAADEKMPLLDLKDLRAMVTEVGKRGKELQTKYGNVSAVSAGAIQRRLLVLEEQGANNFFGEPALDIRDFMRTAPDGRGVINILAADKLMKTPRLYATFLLWMLAQLFDKLPEVGDADKPKLVFFFDEAHLLFSEAPKALLEQVERVTRLIRSKGVGVYYVTQNPRDVPNQCIGAARQPCAACVARLHTDRAEGHPRRRRNLSAQSEARHRAGDPGVEGGRGAGVHAARQGRAVHGAADADPPAVGPHRPGDGRRAARA